MTEVHQLPDLEQSERQASEWIARLNADDVTADDRARFESWRASHRLHARVYDELATTWRAFTAAGPLVRAVSFGQSMNEATTAPRRRRAIVAVAAAMIMMVVSGLWYQAHLSPETVVQTAIGEHSTISLPDGSTLELNTNSLARVAYSADSRIIRLERGQAYFQVAHDTRRPFWVVVGGSWVRAVGTAFDVQRSNMGTVVTVSEGTVKVGLGDVPHEHVSLKQRVDQGPASVVTAGQQGIIQTKSIEVRPLSTDDLSRFIAWRSGMIYFENQSLHEIVDELSRYTTQQLIVDDQQLRDLRLGGMFEASVRGTDSFVTMLQDGFGVHIRRDANRIYIEPGTSDRRQRLAGQNTAHTPPASGSSNGRRN